MVWRTPFRCLRKPSRRPSKKTRRRRRAGALLAAVQRADSSPGGVVLDRGWRAATTTHVRLPARARPAGAAARRGRRADDDEHRPGQRRQGVTGGRHVGRRLVVPVRRSLDRVEISGTTTHPNIAAAVRSGQTIGPAPRRRCSTGTPARRHRPALASLNPLSVPEAHLNLRPPPDGLLEQLRVIR